MGEIYSYGKKEYVLENFRFYDEIREYRAMGDEILELIRNNFIGNVREKWENLERFATRIYTLHIQVNLFLI